MNTWTQTPPDQFGLYWLWEGGKSDRPVIVEVYCIDNGVLYAEDPGCDVPVPLSDYTHCWWCPAEHPPLPAASPQRG